MNELSLAMLFGVAMLMATAPAGAQRRSAFEASVAAAAVPVEDESAAAGPGWPRDPARPGPRLPEEGAPLLLGVTRDGLRRAPVSRYRWMGALAGAAVGVLGYYFTVYQSDYCRDPDFFPCEPGFVVYGVGGAAVGALAGHVMGKRANRP